MRSMTGRLVWCTQRAFECARPTAHFDCKLFRQVYRRQRANNVLNSPVACELNELVHGTDNKWWARTVKAERVGLGQSFDLPPRKYFFDFLQFHGKL